MDLGRLREKRDDHGLHGNPRRRPEVIALVKYVRS
jgi:hypothetical protein